jgi:FlaA1/EpsC-like NDP-sugar epimerase
MTTRLFNRSLLFLLDVGILVAAYVFAYLVRFEAQIPYGYRTRLLSTLPYVVVLQYLLLHQLRVTKVAWRYFGLRDLAQVVGALGAAAAVLLGLRLFALEFLIPSYPGASVAAIPYSILLVDATFAFLGITGIRVLRRMLAERAPASVLPARPEVPTMLVGAGTAGVLVAKEMARCPELGLTPVGFLDDDPVKIGSVIHGIPVVGTTDQLARQCARYGAQQALITIATASGAQIRRITRLCEEARVAARIIPGIHEIVGGQLNLSRIRDVAIEDLLRRDPVELDESAVSAAMRGRVILVTGAGGSIGSELCRQVARFGPARLVLVEQAENNLFHIDRELREAFPNLSIEPCIADICDKHRVEGIFATFSPEVVFHAAAHKHVPMMEKNPAEAVKNNVLGTKMLADTADRFKVLHFVMISTDKAVNPTSVMGVSKRAAEIYIQSLSQRSKTKFVAVRFGNVLGSAGSVVPIFREQIARGGPVTVTDPEMKRYFMTIPEASQLVLQAGAIGAGGEIFVLDMGEPVKVVDLARDLITLSGLRPEEDIEIVFTGMRPGEKLFEELSTAEEHVDQTTHPKIFVGRIRPHEWAEVIRHIGELERAALEADGGRIRDAFRRFVPEYLSTPTPAPPPVRERVTTEIASLSHEDVDIEPVRPSRAPLDVRPSSPLVVGGG